VAENVRSFHMSPTDDRSAKQVVHTGSELGPYSAAVVAGEHCYVAGMGGFKPGTRELVEGGIEAEIKTTLDNLAATLRQAGFRLEDVVSATCYLRDLSNWLVFNQIYRGYFGEKPPARAAVGVNELPAGANVEVTCVAWRAGGPVGAA
jgi:2-iminobutanoate/2-iminopropanoate deaminase